MRLLGDSILLVWDLLKQKRDCVRNFFSEDLAHAALQDDELTVDGSSNAARLRNEGDKKCRLPEPGG